MAAAAVRHLELQVQALQLFKPATWHGASLSLQTARPQGRRRAALARRERAVNAPHVDAAAGASRGSSEAFRRYRSTRTAQSGSMNPAKQSWRGGRSHQPVRGIVEESIDNEQEPGQRPIALSLSL